MKLHLFICIATVLFSFSAGADDEIEQRLGTFSLAGYADQGSKKWEISAEQADISEEIVKLENITACAYGDEGSVTLTADQGSFNRQTKDVYLEKNVVAVTNDGARLTTDYLDWQAEEQILATNSQILVERENIKTSGKGGCARPHLGKVELRQDVMLSVAAGEQSKEAVITCDGPLELDYRNNNAVFNNNVKVKDNRGAISADRVDVFFDPESESITQVVAMNNVRILRGEDIVYGEKAVYNKCENKVVLTGRPRLVLYGSK